MMAGSEGSAGYFLELLAPMMVSAALESLVGEVTGLQLYGR